MSNKDAVKYARELFKRGFTRDAARDILLSRGYSIKDVDDALNIGSKPEKNINITLLLGIVIILLVILIPTLFFLTKSAATDSLSQQTTPKQDSQQDLPQDQTETFECYIDDDCIFDEICQEGYCINLKCSSCEELSNHQCIPIECSDNNSCTNDFCSEGICYNENIISCINPENITQSVCAIDLDCSDGDITTLDSCIEENQTKKCLHVLPSCGVNDGICSSNCTTLTDNDCASFCGNNITESNEECDSNCPLSQSQCNDNNTCTVDALLGSASLCTAECVNTNIIVCSPGDSCCPAGCIYSIDNDCSPNSTMLAAGQFTGVQRTTSGSVELYSYEDNTHKVIFGMAFSIASTELNPNLKVYLASKPVVTTKEDLDLGNLELGQLKSTGGVQEYKINTFVSDIQSYKSVVIFHETYNGVFSYATLNYQ